MGDDDERSFISLKEKQPDSSDDDDNDETGDTDDEDATSDKPESVQNQTNNADGPQEDIVAGSRKPSDDTDETMVNKSNMRDITVPVSLIGAGNLLVVAVIVLLDTFPELWLFVMSFACIEVLVGAALWFFHEVR